MATIKVAIFRGLTHTFTVRSCRFKAWVQRALQHHLHLAQEQPEETVAQPRHPSDLQVTLPSPREQALLNQPEAALLGAV
jgi:hypothetical protein